MKHRFRERELVVYEKQKHGARPGPRARDLRPAAHGEDYDYVVDKFWVVVAVRPDDHLRVRTPGGKLRELEVGDPHLRPATVRERLWLRFRDRRRLDALLHARV